MARLACLLAASAPALILFGCGGGKAVLQSQYGIQTVSVTGADQNSTMYQTTFAYDAKSGATVSVRRMPDGETEVTDVAEISLWTGYVRYFLRNSSPPVCCRMPAPNQPPFPWVHQRTAYSEPECNRPLLKASAFPACEEFVLAKAQAQKMAFDTTIDYHVQAGHGVNESWAEVNATESIETSPEGLLLSMNVTRWANFSRLPVQAGKPGISIEVQNESMVYTMQAGFPYGWDDLETWWKGSCGEPCYEGGDVALGASGVSTASSLDSQMVVV